jgi:sec-independent protein translocase protein TatA
MIMLAALGLLIFGKRLPDVARNVGKSIVEFKKGMNDVQEDIKNSSQAAQLQNTPSQPALASPAAKFDPYTGKPIEEKLPGGTQSI